MKVQKTTHGYYVRLETGEEIVGELIKFVKARDIRMASFTTMGAVAFAELGYYALAKKQYYWKEFDGEFEILGGTGNVSIMQEEPIIHLHMTLSGSDFTAFGGHVKRATVATTCEIVMTVEDGTLLRSYDEHAGLNLWKCS